MSEGIARPFRNLDEYKAQDVVDYINELLFEVSRLRQGLENITKLPAKYPQETTIAAWADIIAKQYLAGLGPTPPKKKK